MASNNDGGTGLVLRDLQSLLQETMDPDVSVIDYKVTSLLIPGENFASTMVRVDAVIKETKNSEEQKLFLVAKMIPQTEFYKKNMDNTASFAKEIFVFARLMPNYRAMEKECGIRDEDLIEILPKFYGGRLSLNKETPKISDSDCVLLMENLKVHGYYTENRKRGMDFEHAKLAVTQLARFHALGVVLKQKRPRLYAECKEYIDIPPLKIVDMEYYVNHTANEILTDPRIGKYEERIRLSLKNSKGWDPITTVNQVEPWLTITHGDFWVNNMMFRKVTDKRTDVKFVDFQLSRLNSPMKDLPFFLCASTNADVVENHFQELLDIYYEKFVEVLRKMGCDVSPFTKRSFNEQLAVDGDANELFRCIMALKLFTFDVDDTEMDKINMISIMFSEGNSLYFDRAWLAFKKFIEMGWL